jgi:hypothetical protein
MSFFEVGSERQRPVRKGGSAWEIGVIAKPEHIWHAKNRPALV